MGIFLTLEEISKVLNFNFIQLKIREKGKLYDDVLEKLIVKLETLEMMIRKNYLQIKDRYIRMLEITNKSFTREFH